VTRPRALALAALLFLVALLPRVLGPLGGFVTVDEAMHWLGRVEAFAAALADGRLADTVLTGHPGVTTMWLGGLGLRLERALVGAGLLAPGFEAHLALLRLPLAAANAAGVAVGYLLLRRLFSPPVALLAALLWALDPFLVAHARLLHVDGLLATFTSLAVLALLAALADAANQARSRIAVASPPIVLAEAPADTAPGPLARGTAALLALSGVLAGLAFLTKVPSVLLIPTATLLLAALAVVGSGQAPPRLRMARTIRRAALPLAIWGGSALVTFFALWPALWVAPGSALGRMLREAVDNGDSPHGWGNFFWGQAIADPGPLFYLVALPFRLTPWALLGLAACLALGLAPRSLVRRQALPALGLALWVLLFSLPLLVAAKKFDRYLLPIFPALDILAALGIVAFAAWIAQGMGNRGQGIGNRQSSPSFVLPRIGVLATTLVAAATIWCYHPYHLAYYNPLLGGGPVAQRVLPVGWGEGMDQAANWLNAQPDLDDGAVASWFEFTLSPYVRGEVFSVGYLRRGQAGFHYLVLYADQVQRRNEPTVVDAYLGLRAPLHTVRIHGLDYAWIYQVPPGFARPAAGRFADRVGFVGYTLDGAQPRPGATLLLELGLAADSPPPADLMVFAHLLGPDGRRAAQIDILARDERFADGGWQRGRTLTRRLPLNIAPDAPPGDYRLVVGLYRLGDGARLPLTEGSPADPRLAGEHALLLETLQLAP
jgi:4-amino-4-deoxy-L-arabinose transferase-like glycosyltransferase